MFVGFLPKTLNGCATEVSSFVLELPRPKPVVVLSAELEVGDILDNSSLGNPSEVIKMSCKVESLTLDSVLVRAEAVFEFRNLDCFEVVGAGGVPTILVNAPWSDPGRTRSILIWPTILGLFVGVKPLSKLLAVVFLISLFTLSKSILS